MGTCLEIAFGVLATCSSQAKLHEPVSLVSSCLASGGSELRPCCRDSKRTSLEPFYNLEAPLLLAACAVLPIIVIVCGVMCLVISSTLTLTATRSTRSRRQGGVLLLARASSKMLGLSFWLPRSTSRNSRRIWISVAAIGLGMLGEFRG